MISAVVAIAFLQVGASLQIESSIPGGPKVANFNLVGHGEEDGKCTANADFYAAGVKELLPEDFNEPTSSGASLLQTDLKSTDYLIPEITFLDKPFGNAAEESDKIGEDGARAHAISLLAQKEMISPLSGRQAQPSFHADHKEP